MKPTIKKIILEFENVPESESTISLQYDHFLNKDGDFEGKVFKLVIEAVLAGIEEDFADDSAVAYQLGYGFYRGLSACKVGTLREAEHPEETDWEDGLVDLERDESGNVFDSHEWFDPLDP